MLGPDHRHVFHHEGPACCDAHHAFNVTTAPSRLFAENDNLAMASYIYPLRHLPP